MLPVIMTMVIAVISMGISKAMLWETALVPAMREYLFPEPQPPIRIDRPATEAKAKIINRPKLNSLGTRFSPNGMATNKRTAGTMARTGADIYSHLSTLSGIISCFDINFKPSASGCIRP